MEEPSWILHKIPTTCRRKAKSIRIENTASSQSNLIKHFYDICCVHNWVNVTQIMPFLFSTNVY